MWQERIQHYLLAGDAEKDPGFRAQLRRLSHIGIQVIGAAEMFVTILMVTANLVLDPKPEMVESRTTMGGLIIGIGLLTIAAARIPVLVPHGRILGCLSALCTSAVLTWFFLRMYEFDRGTVHFVPGNMTLVMLVTVAALPLRPVQTLVFGGTLELFYISINLWTQSVYRLPIGVSSIDVVFIVMLTCLATALSAVVYNQRRSTWQWHTRMLQASENVRNSERQNLLAQNAASVGRLAAALSHELNSPVGALVSGVDTLLLLASRQATSGGTEQQRLVKLQGDLRKSIRESADRLKEIVARMQRFTNLDKAEVQTANVNDILSDVIALLEPNYTGRATVELNLHPVPPLTCRPQQLSAVFSSLLGNAVEATNADGHVCIRTSQKNADVQIDIEDNGRGLDPHQLENIFDPGFRVSQGRVSTGNWSMFSSRQIVREHGGDIEIFSRPGEGTRVQVTLPLEGQTLT